MIKRKIVAIRGGGDIATGIAYRLYKAGFKVMVFEIDKPTVIRRKVAFAQAVYEIEVEVEGVSARLVGDFDEALKCMDEGIIPVLIDPKGDVLIGNKVDIVVDAILAKKNCGTNKYMAKHVIGVGPGFTTDIDVHAVVESNRGHNLGRVILDGSAEPNTGIPGNILGFTEERVIRANNNGKIDVIKDIGALVEKDEVLAKIEGSKVKAKISGVVRGMIQDGFYVTNEMKIGDVDPRGKIENCTSISDKARAIGGGVLEAICYFLNNE